MVLNPFCNYGQRVTHSLKGINLVSSFTGKMLGFHKRSFDRQV